MNNSGTFSSGPSSFGGGLLKFADTGSGNVAGVLGSGIILVPSGYTGSASLSDSATYDNATFASLGVTPGQYIWTWGTGADQRFELDVETTAATPLPAALPLFATGLGGLGLLGWQGAEGASGLIFSTTSRFRVAPAML
jgi:hypothetical protein